jgi:SAM-dependent methyltransferase
MDWWQTFFDETYLRMYRDMTPAERTEREVKGILAMLNLPVGARVLDLCCGQGRHTIRLAQAGLRVTGLDLSPQLLAAARRAAEAAGVDLTLVQRDMRHIPFQGEFDAIVNLFTAFGYFDDTENQNVLHGVARALKPGGQFLIDGPNIYVTNTRYIDKMWFESDLGPVMQEHTWDPWTGRNHSVFYWLENGERKTRSFDVRSYTSYELIAMLRSAGLTPVKLYGGFDMSDYRCQDSRRLIVLAKKDG